MPALMPTHSSSLASFHPPPLAPPSFFSTRLQNSPLSATLHNRHHILSSFLPSPALSSLPPVACHPSPPSAHSSSPVPLVSTKASKPKRTEVGEDLVEDLRSGITGLEALPAPSTASSHPIPLFQPIPSHLASLRLGSALSLVAGPVAFSAPASSATCFQSACPFVSAPPLAPSLSSAPCSSAHSATLSSPGAFGAPALRTVSPFPGSLSPIALSSPPLSPGAVGAPAHASSVSPFLSCAHGTGLSSFSALSSAPVSPGVSGAPALLAPSPSFAPASSALSASPLSPGISDAAALRTVSPASGISSGLPCAQVTGFSSLSSPLSAPVSSRVGVSPCMTGAS